MAERPSLPHRRRAAGLAESATRALSSWRGRRPGLAVWLVLYVVGSTLVLGAVAALVVEQRSGAGNVAEVELWRELEAREAQRHALQARVDRLEAVLAERDQALAQRTRDGDALALALAQAEAERAALEDERRRARERARRLDQGARQTALWLDTAERERLAMERERAALVDRLAAAEEARQLALAEQERLRWRLGLAETRVARLEDEQASAARWLTQWIDERLGAITTVLHETGLETDRLLARLPPDAAQGRGGPFVPWPAEGVGDAAPATRAGVPPAGAILGLGERAAAELMQDLGRLDAALRLLAAVPLIAPFEKFYLTSRFGPRADPFSRRPALHNGLDFGAPAGSEVHATAPGRVSHAGRRGSYGIMVEIDHGHGITTRYAHLSRTLVQPGDRVSLRTPIGIIGSTGRSTGRHLHYEVRLDDKPHDPARFIAAGRQLISAFGS